MTRNRALLALLIALILGAAAMLFWPDPSGHDGDRPHLRASGPAGRPGEAGVMPLHEAVEAVAARYRGRAIRAHLTGPIATESARGVEQVLRIRWLTPDQAVLDIRLDAASGAFLEIAGRGQIAARIPPAEDLD